MSSRALLLAALCVPARGGSVWWEWWETTAECDGGKRGEAPHHNWLHEEDCMHAWDLRRDDPIRHVVGGTMDFRAVCVDPAGPDVKNLNALDDFVHITVYPPNSSCTGPGFKIPPVDTNRCGNHSMRLGQIRLHCTKCWWYYMGESSPAYFVLLPGLLSFLVISLLFNYLFQDRIERYIKRANLTRRRGPKCVAALEAAVTAKEISDPAGYPCAVFVLPPDRWGEGVQQWVEAVEKGDAGALAEDPETESESEPEESLMRPQQILDQLGRLTKQVSRALNVDERKKLRALGIGRATWEKRKRNDSESGQSGTNSRDSSVLLPASALEAMLDSPAAGHAEFRRVEVVSPTTPLPAGAPAPSPTATSTPSGMPRRSVTFREPSKEDIAEIRPPPTRRGGRGSPLHRMQKYGTEDTGRVSTARPLRASSAVTAADPLASSVPRVRRAASARATSGPDSVRRYRQVAAPPPPDSGSDPGSGSDADLVVPPPARPSRRRPSAAAPDGLAPGYAEHAMPYREPLLKDAGPNVADVIDSLDSDRPTLRSLSDEPQRPLTRPVYALRLQGFGKWAVADSRLGTTSMPLLRCRFLQPTAWLPVEITGGREPIFPHAKSGGHGAAALLTGISTAAKAVTAEDVPEEEGGEAESARITDPQQQALWDCLVQTHGCTVLQETADGWALVRLKSDVSVSLPMRALDRIGDFTSPYARVAGEDAAKSAAGKRWERWWGRFELCVGRVTDVRRVPEAKRMGGSAYDVEVHFGPRDGSSTDGVVPGVVTLPGGCLRACTEPEYTADMLNVPVPVVRRAMMAIFISQPPFLVLKGLWLVGVFLFGVKLAYSEGHAGSSGNVWEAYEETYFRLYNSGYPHYLADCFAVGVFLKYNKHTRKMVFKSTVGKVILYAAVFTFLVPVPAFLSHSLPMVFYFGWMVLPVVGLLGGVAKLAWKFRPKPPDVSSHRVYDMQYYRRHHLKFILGIALFCAVCRLCFELIVTIVLQTTFNYAVLVYDSHGYVSTIPDEFGYRSVACFSEKGAKLLDFLRPDGGHEDESS